MERFFLNLKMERIWQQRYPLEAMLDINHYIMSFYNTKKLHSTLRHQRSPTDYENALCKN